MEAVSIYVPSTYNVGTPLTPSQFDKRVERVQRVVGVNFGGFTTTYGVGGWTTTDGQVVTEKVAIVTTFTDSPAYAYAIFEVWAQEYARKWGQEAVTVTRTPIQYAFVLPYPVVQKEVAA